MVETKKSSGVSGLFAGLETFNNEDCFNTCEYKYSDCKKGMCKTILLSDAVARVQELLEQKKKELKEKFRESDLYYTQEIRNVIDKVFSISQGAENER